MSEPQPDSKDKRQTCKKPLASNFEWFTEIALHFGSRSPWYTPELRRPAFRKSIEAKAFHRMPMLPTAPHISVTALDSEIRGSVYARASVAANRPKLPRGKHIHLGPLVEGQLVQVGVGCDVIGLTCH